jgi:transcriptional regulator of acetoin/glycerol metabolism
MGSTPYLFEELNVKPRSRPRRRRNLCLPPGVTRALASLEQTLNAIPETEWEVRRRRWEELQRELSSPRARPQTAAKGTSAEDATASAPERKTRRAG